MTESWPAEQCQVRFIFDFFQCPLAGQQSFNICELFNLCSYFFSTYFLNFLVMQFQFYFFQNYSVVQLHFFLQELVLHKYSVEGFLPKT